MKIFGELTIDTNLTGNITPQQLRKLDNTLVEEMENILDSALAEIGLEATEMHPVMTDGLIAEPV